MRTLKTLQSIYANRTNAVLVIVDVQNRNCHPDGESWDEHKARVVPPALAVIRGLVDRARDAEVPIVYIQSVRTHDEPEVTVFGYKKGMKIGSWDVEIAEEIKPRPQDHVVQKFSHDAFFRTGMDAVLAELVADPTQCYALVVGGATNLCVYHAVMGLYLRNFWTVVVTDGCYTRYDEGRDRALAQFSEPSYPNIFLSRADLIELSADLTFTGPRPVPGR
jgi:nicotinamidase-related amidase